MHRTRTASLTMGAIAAIASAATVQAANIPGSNLQPTVWLKAAALLQSIVSNHALVDGNKRLGWVAVRLFYLLNDADIRPPADAATELTDLIPFEPPPQTTAMARLGNASGLSDSPRR